MAPSSKVGHRPFKAGMWVQVPLASPAERQIMNMEVLIMNMENFLIVCEATVQMFLNFAIPILVIVLLYVLMFACKGGESE